MANRSYALEWFELAEHNLQAAVILFRENHFTDVIGSEVQQALEKCLKSLLAYHDAKIPRTHNLFELYVLQTDIELQDDDISLLELATLYYIEDRYPGPRYTLPPNSEISSLLEFAKRVLIQVQQIITSELISS